MIFSAGSPISLRSRYWREARGRIFLCRPQAHFCLRFRTSRYLYPSIVSQVDILIILIY